MKKATRKPKNAKPSAANGADLARIQLELALELVESSEALLADKIAQAAENAGADLLFMLPTPDGNGMSAVVLVDDEGDDRFLQIQTAESGMMVSEGTEMDQHLLRLARASVDVLRRINDDKSIRTPLASAAE
jgi:hypothetical protein